MGSSLWYCSPSTVIGRKTVEFLLYLVHNGTSATGRPGYVVIVNKAIRLFFIYIYICLWSWNIRNSHTFLKICTKQQTTTVRSRGQCRYRRRASDPIAHSWPVSPAGVLQVILGFQMAKHVPKRLKITLTKGQKMCRNTASCLNSYGTIQYARLKKTTCTSEGHTNP